MNWIRKYNRLPREIIDTSLNDDLWLIKQSIYYITMHMSPNLLLTHRPLKQDKKHSAPTAPKKY